MKNLILKMASQDPQFRRDLILKLAAGRPKSNHKPGDVWPVKGGFRSMSPRGVAKTFKTQEQAKAHSKSFGKKKKNEFAEIEKKQKTRSPEDKKYDNTFREVSLLKDKTDSKKETKSGPGSKSKSFYSGEPSGNESKKDVGKKQPRGRGKSTKKKQLLTIHEESQGSKINKAKPRKWDEGNTKDKTDGKNKK